MLKIYLGWIKKSYPHANFKLMSEDKHLK